MARRPVIGIATQTLDPSTSRQPPCWAIGQCYVRVLADAGAVPWVVPLLEDEATLRAIYQHLDGVFLTGGVDVDPACYGEERHPLCDHGDPSRDRTEIALIRWAVAEGKPVLGICRGIQVLNVACGGSLYQDVAALLPHAIKHDYFSATNGHPRDYLAHPVQVRPGSRLERVLGTEGCQVNSMHHQGLKKLAPGFTASAFAPDGLVEGIEKPGDGFVVGVQWHPEEMVEESAPMRRLFAAFVAVAQSPGP
jgi:putative glutamine amidotransferase